MLRNLLILASLLALSACSKARAPDAADSLVRTIHTASAQEANALVKTASLTCKSVDACSAAVGMLAAQNESDVLICTAFLVGNDLVATNSHCIPSAVKLMPDLCSEKVKLILPATDGLAEETFSCKKLEAFSERPNDISPDLALFRLDRATKRRPLPLSEGGMIPANQYVAYKVNPIRSQPKSPWGELVAENCSAVANSYLFPFYRSAADSVFTTSCDPVPGNSGSPLLGSDGLVAGLLQASLTLSKEQNEVWKPYLADNEANFAPLSLGTSLACLDPSNKIRDNCVPLFQDEMDRPRVTDFLESSELVSETAELLKPYFAQNENFFWQRFVVKRSTLERIESLEPKCIVQSGGSDPALSEATIPTFAIRVAFNRYLQPSAHARLKSAEHQEFRFSRFDLQRVGEARVQSSSGLSWTISDCP